MALAGEERRDRTGTEFARVFLVEGARRYAAALVAHVLEHEGGPEIMLSESSLDSFTDQATEWELSEPEVPMLVSRQVG